MEIWQFMSSPQKYSSTKDKVRFVRVYWQLTNYECVFECKLVRVCKVFSQSIRITSNISVHTRMYILVDDLYLDVNNTNIN